MTDASNLEVSRAWEGKLCLAVKDGSLCFLFEIGLFLSQLGI
jgi:hypothetical protein